jgi:hypothetical protein
MTFFQRMQKFFGIRTLGLIIALFGGTVALILGVIAGVWLLWIWIWPQVWPAGPEAFVNPGFWLFVGMWILVGFVARLFRQ